MTVSDPPSRGRRVPTAVAAGLACAVLAAGCGGGSSSSSHAPATTGGATAGQAPAGGPGSGGFGARRAALQACLSRHGVTLPPRPAGVAPGQGRGRLRTLLNTPKFRAALRKCGFAPGRFGGGRFSNPQFRAQIQAFATCVRRNGFAMPSPNRAGAPYRPNQLNRNDPKFQAAAAKCRRYLPRFGPGGAGGPGAPGAPPGSAQ